MQIKGKYCIIVLALLLQSSALFAQYTSVRGWFKVDFISGCTGLTVNVDTTAASPLPCFYGANCPVDWGDGTQGQNVTTHTYSESGVFNLKVFFQNDNGPDSIQIDINESLPPEFNLFACTNRQVVVNITDTGYDNYIITSNDGSGTVDTVAQGAPDQIYTYATATNQTISVRGFDNDAADNCDNASQTITALNALPGGAINSLEVLSQDELVLTYSLANNILYQLQIASNGNSTFAPFKTLTSAITTDTIRGLDFQNDYFCFRIATKNACDNTNDKLSEPICSINASLDIQDSFNQLNWVTQNPGIGFDIIRDDNASIPLVSLPANTRGFDDSDIICDTEYCYTIVAQYNNGITSTSLPVCGTSFSTSPPNAIENISTIVGGAGITVIWEPPASNTNLEYSLYRSTNNQRSLIANTDTTFYNITNLEPTLEHCFEVLVRDECGNETTASVVGCTLLLSGGINKENNVNIVWDTYQGWENGVSNYIVRKSYDLTNVTSTSTTETAFSETDNSDNQVIYYAIVGRPNDNLNNSISNTIKVVKPNNIYFPNAFTPDGDGNNETFEVNGRFITSFELYIFDRWGKLMYTSTDMASGWDGTAGGKELPQGTYAFRAKMLDQAGREIEKTGTIVLLRK